MKIKRISALTLFTLLLCVGFISAQGIESLELKNISLEKSENQLGVKLEITLPVNYESFTLFNPDRLIIDFLDVQTFSCAPRIDVNDFGVLAIRTAKNQPDVTRVVFELMESVPAYSIEEKEDGLFVYFKPETPIEEVTEREIPVEIKEESRPVRNETKKEEEKPVSKPQPKLTRKVPPLPRIESEEGSEVSRKKIITIGFGGGAYFIQDGDFQDVYGKSTGFLGGELNFFIPIKGRDGIAIGVDLKSISATGQTTWTDEEVTLKLTPFSFTAFYMRQYGRIVPFVGLGGSIFNYEETYPATFAIPSTKGSTFGMNLQIGTYIKFIESLSLKIYFKFHDARTQVNNVNANMGGNEYGIGLAYHFKL